MSFRIWKVSGRMSSISCYVLTMAEQIFNGVRQVLPIDD